MEPELEPLDFEPGWERRWVRKNARRLWRLRLDRGMSQKQLADEAGINVSQVSRVELGRDAQLTTFLKIYDGLGYRLEWGIQETCEEAGALLYAEAERRFARRDAGLLMGKRWR